MAEVPRLCVGGVGEGGAGGGGREGADEQAHGGNPGGDHRGHGRVPEGDEEDEQGRCRGLDGGEWAVQVV